MTGHQRVLAFAVLLVVVLGGSAAFALGDLRRSQEVRRTAPDVPVTSTGPGAGRPAEPYLVFRHTGLDQEYGVVATVPLADPAGSRTFTGTACDRVYATRETASCLVSERGVVTTFAEEDLGADWQVLDTAPLAGLPSRTRTSADGTLVASTSFVTGHDYQQVGFSTATEIHRPGGTDHGNLEKFQLVVDGREVSPADRNIWGVTFGDDDTTFWATVATGGTTYLAHGDLGARTLTTLVAGVECPSLSPDGTRIAFKQAGTVDGSPGWTPAVLDLATLERTVLRGETHDVDDQLEWLDDDTVLYGLARPDEPGVTDVWALDTTAGATPRLLVPQAWSPSVVR